MINKIRPYINRRKYEILVISFLLIIFGNTFSNVIMLTVLLPLQNMIIALMIYYKNKTLKLTIFSIIILTISIAVFNHCHFTQLGVGLICTLYFSYFVLISINVYRKIFTAKFISSEMIATVLCGFILLCLIGAILFITIEVNRAHSFLNIEEGISRFDNLTYFSFTTLLTIGFGDIIPLTLIAKRAVMLVGLAGHFYTVFLTGIIIGKYIGRERNRGHVLNKVNA